MHEPQRTAAMEGSDESSSSVATEVVHTGVTESATGSDGSSEAVPTAPSAVMVTSPSRGSIVPSPGERYTVGSRLGQGGMGEVRLCNDRVIGRDIALKVLRADTERTADARARFLREACVQGQLEHPAVVPVYDMGSDASGEPYFTMKRVRGRTLEQILEAHQHGDEEAKRRFNRRKLLTAFGQVCLAVDFAHSRGIVHRDLKPGNLMLGDFGEVYVLDWGVAKGSLVDTSESAVVSAVISAHAPPSIAKVEAVSAATAYGAVVGTPGYLSPEQARGERSIDARSDVYALGAILFEVLTLERLHQGGAKERLASTLADVDVRLRMRASEADVPPELEAICERATRRDPEGRFASPRALWEHIEQYLDGDRDLSTRRKLASAHAESAEKASVRALGDGPDSEEARRVAMREVSRALALDPDNASAMQTLVTLLVEPPRVLPAEVKAELDALSSAHVRVGGRTGAIAYSVAAALSLAQLVFDVKNLAWVLASTALMTATAATSFVINRLSRASPRHSFVVFVVSTIALTSFVGVFGAFLGVPAFIAANTFLFAATNARAFRVPIIALGALFLAAPAVLELAGVLPRSTSFTSAGMLIHPPAVSLGERFTPIVLIVTLVVTVACGGMALGPFRDDLDAAQRRVRLLAWQLRQLVPGASRLNQERREKPKN